MEILENKIHLFHYNPIWNFESDAKNFIEFLENNENIHILLDNTDDSCVIFGNHLELWNEIYNISIKNKIKITILSIGEQKNKNKFDNFEYISFPISHLYGTYDTILRNRKDYNGQLKIYDKFKPKYFIKSLNRQPHLSRCMMIDQLEAHRLINSNSLITWNYHTDCGYYKDYEKYNFQYWEEKLIQIDNPDDWSTQYTSDIIDNNNSLIHLVGETPTDTIGFTEKTWKPILNGEIFIIYGNTKQNQQLLEYGFSLYDEIIDYEFDNLDLQKGIPYIVNQLTKIQNVKFSDIYEKVKHKIRHNHITAIDIIRNKKFIPNIIKNKDDLEIHSMSYNLIPILQDEN